MGSIGIKCTHRWGRKTNNLLCMAYRLRHYVLNNVPLSICSSSAILPCELGTFSLGNQSACTLCPLGMECPASDGSMNVNCAPGSYSTGRSASCTPCPPGYACPYTDQDIEIQCPPGSYSTGIQSACSTCPPGL